MSVNAVERALQKAMDDYVLQIILDLPPGNGLMNRMAIARQELLTRVREHAGPDLPTRRDPD